MRVYLLLLIIWSCLVFGRQNQFGICFGACQQILRSVEFNDTDPETGETCLGRRCGCSSRFGIPSLYLCSGIHCSSEETDRGISHLRQTCVSLANVTLPPYSIVGDYTDHEIEQLRHLEPNDIFEENTATFNEVVVPSKRVFQLARDTLDAAAFERKIHVQYGFAMYYFWIIVIAIGLISHLARLIDDKDPRRASPSAFATESSTWRRRNRPFSRSYNFIQRYITVPATFGYKRSQSLSWWGTLPTRVQSITISGFVILNIVLCSIRYHVFEDNIYWRDISTQTWRYVADRTGIISTANLILIWVFGIRNNTLLWLTGWDFATFSNFHRWVARVATVEAVVHSVAYTVLIFKGGSWKEGWDLYVDYYHQRWFVTGVLATIFMAAICGVSIYGLRRNAYEVFLLLHIALSVLVIVTMWYHVEIFNGEYNWYIWPCVIIWVSDRVLRFLRIYLFNPRFWDTKALATYDKSSNIVRLVVPQKSAFLKPRPGTFYYITVLNDWRIWESHPFTLGYLTSEDQPSDSLSMDPMFAPFSPSEPADELSGESESLLKSNSSQSSSLVFIIRPYNGFTARLRDFSLLHPTKLNMLFDGPYGETQPFHKYANVLFIVGGAGITVPLSYINLLLGEIRETSSTTSLRIVWAVREAKFLADVVERDFGGALENEKVSLSAYITQEAEAEALEVPKAVRVRHGRPDVRREIEEEVRDSGGDSLAVVACGPGKMADDARRAVVEILGKGRSRIEYFEESFNW